MVNGTLTWPSDLDDFVKWSGLVGTSYSLYSLTMTDGSGLYSALRVYSSSNGYDSNRALPNDGVLIVDGNAN